MNTYSRKIRWKLIIFIAAILIGAGSLFYTNYLVNKLSIEERKKVQLWAQAYRELQDVELGEEFSPIIYNIIKGNTTIPVIFVNENNEIITHANLDSPRANNEEYLRRQLEIMKSQHRPIVFDSGDNLKQYIYYKDSTLLTKLTYYPFIQLGIITLFIFVSYLAFSSSRQAEQNQVWVGLSKETAHQLGTPISSLLAWHEMLKIKLDDQNLLQEVEKDLNRLQKITDRFSKIGSAPDLVPADITRVVMSSVNYLKTRTSGKIKYQLDFPGKGEIMVPLNSSLFEWVIENLCKNSIDAMAGKGTITIRIIDQVQVIYIDIEDTGKGIPKSRYKSIFHPGFTSKNTGWGLGVSLSKRIVEFYHKGKIFVKNSEINKGSTIRIVLKK